ncbi:ribonuclease BN [Cellulomonas flavigena DSM 20109]|uniref:Ribonuclease BN n=1 Tax=Cellulomonas flavigena (strain ATCC 482 / DSM 20109 / BCRC 11376 / JCM 18109 / NBRC 3775 / NCIMB 8073 / NRS 134) TaxID=446466 RepID=D5UKV0_CELFN|nr:YihY/virulence factor BrkB family protein [Cellulomonas flavigena]ADG73918.1 ribonuclease BN [Cellulomonas flavigena DSM 20109]
MEPSPDRHEPSTAGPAAGEGAAYVRASGQAPDPVEQHRWTPGGAGLVERFRALLAWWQATRVARANARFGQAGGGLLTGGIAYTSLFSVFAGLTIGYTAFMAVLGNNAELRETVLLTISEALPGIIDTGDGTGLLEPDELVMTAGLSVAGVVAFGVLLFSAISATSALRTAVRAMFGAHDAVTIVAGKLRELGGFVGIALAVLLSAVLGIVVTTAADWLLGALGISDGSGVVLRVVGIVVAFVVDALVFVMVVRVLAGQAPPRRDLLHGAGIAAAGLGVVRVLGTSVVAGSVQANPVLASFALVVVLLLWINLIARIVLLAAAWTANPPASPDAVPDDDGPRGG